MSSDQSAPLWLGYIGDEILPSYVGIIIVHYEDPYSPTSMMEGHKGFERCSCEEPTPVTFTICIPRPSQNVKLQVCFWWLRSSNFRSLEVSGVNLYFMYTIRIETGP